jgi:DNA-3-methyladenine glycosylase I
VDHHPQARDAFRAAFDDFDPDKVAAYGDEDRARLMADAGIIRSNAKIDAAINGARIYLRDARGGRGLLEFLWSAVDGKHHPEQLDHGDRCPPATPEGDMAKALKAKGFKFVGPVIVYAFMQATGLVNDHLTCFRHAQCKAMSR